MAAYASTITILGELPVGVTPYRIIFGTIDVTNYNTTTVAESDITKYFPTSTLSGYETGILALIAAPSDNGLIYTFDPSTGKLKAWYIDNDATADSAMIESASDVDAGASFFIAIGMR